MKTLANTIHGSYLYRLNGPNSDRDDKSIHLPSIDDCVLLRAECNVRREERILGVKYEYESFALQEFLALASRGEDVAIAMLHASDDDIHTTSPTFQYLRKHRHMFYTKRMAGSVGFCRSMAARYALRADRMQTVETIIEILKLMIADGVPRLGDAWDLLPDLPHTVKRESHRDQGADKRLYEVVGKGLPATIVPAYALGVLEKVRDEYGARVKAARSMDNRDWKSISHSFRVGQQLKSIFTEGTFSYPLPQSDFIRAVKEGKLSYVDDKIDEKLNALISEVEALSAKSTFPDAVDQKWTDQIVLDAYGEQAIRDLA